MGLRVVTRERTDTHEETIAFRTGVLAQQALPCTRAMASSLPQCLLLAKVRLKQKEAHEVLPCRLPSTLKRKGAIQADLAVALRKVQLEPRTAKHQKLETHQFLGGSSATRAQLRSLGSSALFDVAAFEEGSSASRRLQLCPRCLRWNACQAPCGATGYAAPISCHGGEPLTASLWLSAGTLELRVDLAPQLLGILRRCPWPGVQWSGVAGLVDLRSEAARLGWTAGLRRLEGDEEESRPETLDGNELIAWSRQRERPAEWRSEHRSLVACGEWLDAGVETVVEARSSLSGGAVFELDAGMRARLLRGLVLSEEGKDTDGPTIALASTEEAKTLNSWPRTLAVTCALELGGLIEESLRDVTLLVVPHALASSPRSPLLPGGALHGFKWRRVILVNESATGTYAKLLAGLEAESRWLLAACWRDGNTKSVAAFLRAPLLRHEEERSFARRYICFGASIRLVRYRRELVKVALCGLERACYEAAYIQTQLEGECKVAWARCKRLCSHWAPEPGHASVQDAYAAALQALEREAARHRLTLSADAETLGPASSSRVKDRMQQLEEQRRFVEHCAAKASETDVCAICQQELTPSEERLLLPCAHVFHAECLIRYQASMPSGRCSICRRETRPRMGSRVVARPLWIHAETTSESSKMRAAAQIIAAHCARQDTSCLLVPATWEARHLRRALTARGLADGESKTRLRIGEIGALLEKSIQDVSSVLFLSPTSTLDEEQEIVQRLSSPGQVEVRVFVLYCHDTLEEQTLRTRGCIQDNASR